MTPTLKDINLLSDFVNGIQYLPLRLNGARA
jgi:hypothetical protein